MSSEPAGSPTEGAIRHIVLVCFKPDADTASRAEAIAHFTRMRTEIPGVTAFEQGANNSLEGKSKGLTHAFVLTFESAAARDAYLPHPAHQALSSRLRAVIDDVLVFDYTPL